MSDDLVLISGLRNIESQLSQILDGVSEEVYTLPIANGSSIGAHVRHVIEFVQILADTESLVDYDNRARNPQIEESPKIAKEAISKAVTVILEKIAKFGPDHLIKTTENLSVECGSVSTLSSLGREITYVIQHGVHHIYIIKTMAEMHDVTLDKDIGVAAATLKHQQSQCAR